MAWDESVTDFVLFLEADMRAVDFKGGRLKGGEVVESRAATGPKLVLPYSTPTPSWITIATGLVPSLHLSSRPSHGVPLVQQPPPPLPHLTYPSQHTTPKIPANVLPLLFF